MYQQVSNFFKTGDILDKKSRELSYVPTGPSFFKKGKILAYSKLTSTFHSQIRLNQIRSAKCIYLTALATWQPKVKNILL